MWESINLTNVHPPHCQTPCKRSRNLLSMKATPSIMHRVQYKSQDHKEGRTETCSTPFTDPRCPHLGQTPNDVCLTCRCLYMVYPEWLEVGYTSSSGSGYEMQRPISDLACIRIEIHLSPSSAPVRQAKSLKCLCLRSRSPSLNFDKTRVKPS